MKTGFGLIYECKQWKWRKLSKTVSKKLTADRSTTELRWIALGDAEHTLASPFVQGKRRFRYKRKAARAAVLEEIGCGGWI